MSKINVMFTLRLFLQRWGYPGVLGRNEVATTWSRAVGKDRGGATPLCQSLTQLHLCPPNLTGSARYQGQTHPCFQDFCRKDVKNTRPTWRVSQF